MFNLLKKWFTSEKSAQGSRARGYGQKMSPSQSSGKSSFNTNSSNFHSGTSDPGFFPFRTYTYGSDSRSDYGSDSSDSCGGGDGGGGDGGGGGGGD